MAGEVSIKGFLPAVVWLYSARRVISSVGRAADS
jgi:hypothetical protein